MIASERPKSFATLMHCISIANQNTCYAPTQAGKISYLYFAISLTFCVEGPLALFTGRLWA